MHSLFFFGFPLSNLKLSLGILCRESIAGFPGRVKESSACQERFARPQLKIVSPLTTERASRERERERVCDTGHAFMPRNVNPAWTGLTADKGRNEDTLILHEKNQQELRLHSVADCRFDSYQ